jgi:hypothetical protein
MRRLLKGIAILAAASTALPAFAATLQPIQAGVMINRGNGFRDVAGATQAKVGDIVMAAPGGRARLVYEDGCKVSVEPGGVVTVKKLSPCLANAYGAELGLPTKAPEAPPPVDYSWLVVPVVAGGIACGLFCWPHHKPPPPFVPVSP